MTATDEKKMVREAVGIFFETKHLNDAIGDLLKSGSDAEYLGEQLDEGHLLHFVRTSGAEREAKAVHILSKHCGFGFDARVYSVPDCR